MNVYETEHYRVLVFNASQPCGCTVIFFGHWRSDYHPYQAGQFEDFYEDNFLTNAGINSIFIQTNKNDWYQTLDMNDLATVVKNEINPSDICLSYGNSMGGTGAIIFSDLLGVDFFVATSPQASIRRSFMTSLMDDRWPDCHRPSSKSNYDFIVERKLKSRGVVFFDSSNLHDSKHANIIAGSTDSKMIECPGTYHHSGRLLQSEVGVVKFLKQLSIVLSEGIQLELDSYLQNVSQSLKESINGRFVEADTWLERLYLAVDVGFDRLSKSLDPWFVFNEFETSPTVDGAIFLIIYSRFLDEKRHMGTVSHLLNVSGFGGLLSKI